MQRLAGHTIVVTGAARGLGQVIASTLARAGAKIVLGDILDAEGAAVAKALHAQGGDARYVTLDLADPQSIIRFAANVAAHEGHIDGLVNNAAIATGIGGKAFDEIEIEVWDRVMQVNVRGTWLITRVLVPLLGQSPHGRIVALGRTQTVGVRRQ
jgi:NAD(P)-dependent dehydrogenase (short-subunit alcohol dehydrogenase family)